jgi:outer membrane protein assembly factor BamB
MHHLGDGRRPTRREVLIGTAAGAGALVLPGQEAAAQGAAELDPWPYGRNSFATDTVLMFRGNPAHTFYGTGPLPETAPRILWRHRTASIPQTLRGRAIVWAGTGWTGTAAKLGDYVYVGSVGGYLYCLEAMTGGLVWSYRAGGLFKSSVCLYDNKVYIGNTDNHLHCVDAATGRRVWAFNSGRDLDSSPCVVDGVLYIAGENGYARAMDPQTGKEIWKTFVGGIGPGTEPGSNGSETSPAIADGQLYTANYDGDLYSIDTKDGKVRWKARTNDDTDASAVIAGEFVYAASEERVSHLYCFAREDGREVWRYSANRMGFWSTPACANGRIYVGGDDTNLHCVDAKTGEGIWTFKTGGAVWSSPAVVDGKVVFGSRDFNLYCVDAQSGREIWRVQADGRIISSPCIVGGHIWIGTATGWFYCLGP